MPIEKLNEEDVQDYLILNEMTQNKDLKFYVCYQCKQDIKNKKALKNEENLLNLPAGIQDIFKEKLKQL